MNLIKFKEFFFKNSFVVYSILVLTIGFFTYFVNYHEPDAPFWDENFHIAAAEKYINNTFFVELHPPLGKLLIASGEVLWNPNKGVEKRGPSNKVAFYETDYVKEFPQNLSFIGYRFFPALLAFLSCYLFFLILYFISKNDHLAFLFSSLILFNNTMITHFRAAMLDGIQIFFVLLSLAYFVYLITQKTKLKWINYLILGTLIGLAVSTKINSLILIVIFPFLYWAEIRDRFHDILENRRQMWQSLKNPTEKIMTFLTVIAGGYFGDKIFLKTEKYGYNRFLPKLASFFAGIALIFIVVQYIHINLATKQLPDKGPYNGQQLSSEYRWVVDNKAFLNPISPVLSSVGWWNFQTQYNKGVPKLDVTKPDENGSYPTNWTVGRKAISYRWDKNAVAKGKNNTYFPFLIAPSDQKTLGEYSALPQNEKEKYDITVRYMYLAIHPIIWLISIIGLIFALVLSFSHWFYGMKITNNKLFTIILSFFALYLLYMASVIPVERVLYMYHYFVPLIFALLLSFTVFFYSVEEKLEKPHTAKYIYISAISMALVVFLVFVWFMPFSYYLPLTADEFRMRNWFPFWGLKNA